MTVLKTSITGIICALFLNFSGTAQVKNTSDPVLIEKTNQYAQEVFKNYLTFAGPEYMPDYIENVSRVAIIKEPQKAKETYPLLSSIGLVDKYNPEIKRDHAENFNPEKFNSLKYFFNFYSKEIQKIRVDNSDYLILIYPKP